MANKGVRGHLLVLANLALAYRAFVEIALPVGRHCDHARNAVLLLDDTAQHTIRGLPDFTFHGLLFPAAKAAILAPVPSSG
jgi:hypothetical protein